MADFFLELPRVSASVSVPSRMADDFRQTFAAIMPDAPPREVQYRFVVVPDGSGIALLEGVAPLGTFSNVPELMFALEEILENALIARIGNWVGLHAGAAALDSAAIVVVGRPDTGKTTTIFQLVELGLDLLCEEVTPVDPATCAVHPCPLNLSFDRRYAESFESRFPTRNGSLHYHRTMARYSPARVRKSAVRLGAILFPAFSVSARPRIAEARASDILTDLLQCCYSPGGDDERLLDDVIRLVERCRLFRLDTCGIESSRALLADVISELS